MSPKQLPANNKDSDIGDNHCNDDDVDHYDDDVDLRQVVVLADPFNCNALAVQVAHHPHCPTDHYLDDVDGDDVQLNGNVNERYNAKSQRI